MQEVQEPQETLTSSALKAIRWNYVGFFTRSVSSFAVGTILARLLGPKPFGQLGVAFILFGLGNVLADAGVGSALVQIPELTERQIRSAFTMQLLFGCLITAIAFSIAPAVGLAVHDPGVVGVVRGVSPLFLLVSLGQTSTGLLKRQIRFQPIQAAYIISYLVGFAAVAVPMAWAGYGVWSLVAACLIQPLLCSVIVYANVRHSLRLHIDRSALRLLWFGAQVTSANIFNWSISNLDNILVGHAFGSTNLGLYSRGFNLASVPIEGLVNTFQQVLFTSCSRVEQRFDRMRRAYLAVIGGIALVTFPVFWSLAVSAKIVIVGLYGPKWIEAAPLFMAFAAAMPFFALMATAGPVLGAADRVDREIWTQGASLLFALALFASTARISLQAVAWAVPIVYAFRFWCITRPTLQMLGLRWRDLGTVVAGPLVAAVFTTTCVFVVSWALRGSTLAPALQLVEVAFVGLLSILLIAYVGRGRIIPAALLAPLRAKTSNMPTPIAKVLRFFAASSDS